MPDQSVQLFLAANNHLNTEASVMEELSLVNHEVYIPLPCEQDELSLLKTYLNRVRDDLVETDHWGIFPVISSVETANKIKKLGADTAKKLGSLASGATSSTMAGFRGEMPNIMQPAVGGGGASTASGSQAMQTHGPSQMTSPTAGAGEGQTAAPAPPPTKNVLGKKVKVQRPAFIAESLEDQDSLYGLSQRAVAIESCFFILEVCNRINMDRLTR